MKKQIFFLFCLSLLCIAPACKRDQKVTSIEEQEEINTMIDVDDTIIFEEETIIKDKKIMKF